MNRGFPLTIAVGMFFLGLFVGQTFTHVESQNTSDAINTAKRALKAANNWEAVAKNNEKITTDCINLLRQGSH